MPENQPVSLSIIITIVDGPLCLRRCLDRLVPQISGLPVEVIVPFDATVSGIEAFEEEYPQIRFVCMGRVQTTSKPGTQAAAHEIYDRRKAYGLKMARGRILALLDDSCAPDPDWCDQVLTAHESPHSAIGGAVEHEGRGGFNWAVYFLDFGRYQLPLEEGSSTYLTDVNISYKREALESVRHLWEDRYKEVTINWELARKGQVLWRRPQIVVRQDRGRLSLKQLMVERYSWGRLFGSIRAHEVSPAIRLLYILFSPAIPLILIGRMAGKVFGGKRNRLVFLRSLPQTMVVTSVWCLGEFAGYLTGKEASI